MSALRRAPRPAVLDEIPLQGHAVIEASAGTGKTFTIEHLVVDRLLRTPATLEEVLVVTFTEKATTELRSRIRRKIESILTAEVVEVPEWTEGADPVVEGGTAWIIDAVGRARLDAALFAFDRAPIFTIHGFCHRVLGDLAFDSGQLFDQALVDSTRAFNRAFREVLRTRLTTDDAHRERLKRWLSEGRAVSELEALLREAHRQRYLHTNQPLDDELPALLDHLATTLDVGSLVTDYAGAALQRKAIDGAEHALRALQSALALEAAPLERLEAVAAVDHQAILRPHRTGAASKRTFPDEMRAETKALLAGLERLLVLKALAHAVEREIVDAFLPEVVEAIERAKRREGELDYDDLLDRVWHGLAGPRGEALVAALRQRYHIALIDEFQDTDDRQWDIFRRVFVDDTTEHALAIIGDPKQAIYGFRGADVHTYLHARRDLVASGAARVPLATNFRSSPATIEAVNAILDQTAKHPLFTGEIRYDEPVRAGKDGWGLANAADAPLAPVHLWRYRPQPPRGRNRTTVPKYELNGAFSQALAESLKTLLSAPVTVFIDDEERGRRPIEARDVFVLVRGRWDAVDAAAALRRAGVPYAFYKQEGLFQSSESKDILDVLAAVAAPHDRSARLKAFATPFFGVPWRDLGRYRDLPGGHPLTERLHAWRQLGEQERYSTLFHRMLHDSGLVERLLFAQDDDRALTNYQHILEMLLEAGGRRRLSLAELVELLQRYIDKKESPEGADGNVQRLTTVQDAVQIMTIHKSKGLEAPVVCVYGGFGPARPRPVSVVHDPLQGRRVLLGEAARDTAADHLAREQAEEDQRLLYVALTRARSRIYLPFIDSSRAVPGSYRPLKDRLYEMGQADGFADPRLFHVETVEPRARTRPRRPGAVVGGAEPLDAWRPPSVLVAERVATAQFDELRARHAPLVVTSYTRMKAEAEARGHLERRSEAPVDADEFKTDASALADVPSEDEDRLPGGRHMGRFLHESIEDLPFQRFRGADLESWSAEPEVQAVFEAAALRHGIDPRWIPEAQRLVFGTLTQPTPVGDAGRINGLWRRRHLIELEFLYPLPEAHHALLEADPALGFQVERGYVKGFIDFLFEQKGRVYIVDWKSDQLGDFGPEALTQHVQGHYDLQAQLYTLGVVRWLGLRDEAAYEARFGGVLYVFLRGVDGKGAGVWFDRPSWSTVLGWERALIDAPV